MKTIPEKYELYSGQSVIVDYKAQYNQDIIDYFNEESNLEGFAELLSIDMDSGLFTIKGFPLDDISLEYLIAFNDETNEYEYVEVEYNDNI